MIRDFLEGSTIHGLVHISTAKSKTARVARVAIVVACFALAMYMINDILHGVAGVAGVNDDHHPPHH